MKNKRLLLLAAVLAFGTTLCPPATQAKIVRIQINTIESPTFEGSSFGEVGQYEKLVGRAFGELDPDDPHNAVIVDIGLAPRNASGMVEYSMDIYILRPVDSSHGNGRLFFEINNGGSKLSFPNINDSTSGGNDPTTAADAGNGFLMRQGYTIVWSGWDITAVPANHGLTITVPVAKNPDGTSIVGRSLEEFIIDNSTTMTGPLTYAAANLDKSQASLTVRNHYADFRAPIPAAGWEYVNAKTIRLLPAGTPFQRGTLYEFTYPAKDPLVAGIGLAATRDFATFLRLAETDDFGTPNPLAGKVQFIYTFSVSQPSRYMHDFLYLGFNADEQGQQVFDAIDNYIGGGTGGFINFRFAQPRRTHRQHIGRSFPEARFPFTNQIISDPVTGQTDGRLRRCLETNTCPKIFETNSENEYWSKAGSLLHTDTLGNDLPLHEAPNVRMYLLSSLPHSPVPATDLGNCQQPRNSVLANPAHRALLVALDEWVSGGTVPGTVPPHDHGDHRERRDRHDEWVSEGTVPPPSRIPRRSNGTLVPSLPQESVGFPNIPGVIYNGLNHTGDLFDFGPLFDQGILTILPPVVTERYPALVPRTDPDGNDIAGIRLPEIAVPLATYTGWALRAGPAAGDGCDAAGQQIAFAKTKAERLANGDPRLSIEERYQTHERYVKAVERVVRKLVRKRLLLEEDAERYIVAAEASDVLR